MDIRASLAPGEHIRWSGQPDPFTSMASKAGLAIFALPWIGMSASGAAAAHAGGKVVGTLFGLAFVVIGLAMLLAPIWELRRAGQTRYVITDRRLIMIHRNGRSVTSIRLSAINQVERIVKWNRISLRIPTLLVSDGEDGQKIDYTNLHGIPDGERAYHLLTQGTAEGPVTACYPGLRSRRDCMT